eukprot:TRINITY_DN1653_c7_g1_i1.p1 TRINITY_DN1653_c7_g1~~TRINITY_DN1653_c7_g1_i1.p1  ORF type:complete len:141 (+),score=18.92 TRINITY_DN1653_c7_g1_i1:42-425(+)
MFAVSHAPLGRPPLTSYRVPPLDMGGGCPLLDWSSDETEAFCEFYDCDDNVPEGNRLASASVDSVSVAGVLSPLEAKTAALDALARQKVLSLHPAVLHELSKQCGDRTWNSLSWAEKYNIATTQLGL